MGVDLHEEKVGSRSSEVSDILSALADNYGPRPKQLGWTCSENEKRKSRMTKHLLIVLVVIVCSTLTFAQFSESVIFSFNLTDGNLPDGGLVADSQGNLYGTTAYNGGKYGFGNIFELSPDGSGGWTETVLYDFTGKADGAWPLDTLIFDGAGNLYGTAEAGGQGDCTNTGEGCGVVFELVRGQGGWSEKVLFSFVPGQVKGVFPVGGLVFDKAGNLYGTTWAPGVEGGPLAVRRNHSPANSYWGCTLPGCGGTVYELSPTANGWKETDLYAFAGTTDGSASVASLIFDQAGTLYGTTQFGGTTGCTSGYGCGVVFKLTPSNGSWSETLLHTFTGGNDGAYPTANLIADKAGNLYSTTSAGGSLNNGTVFVLSAAQRWKETVLHTFTGGQDGGTPFAGVIMDSRGDLIGTTNQGGNNWGVVYGLRRVDGHLIDKVLHAFTMGSDGENPYAPAILGPNGYLYGTTQGGGSQGGHGAVFEIIP
jgi:uncharacterized repeat protein (TIGR03803 family)